MIFLIFLLGLITGSFISAISYRIVRGEDFVNGRSKCDKCGKLISWYDNIPLLSYLFLRGKCRNCGKKISFRYPLIELFTAVVFLLIYYFNSVSLVNTSSVSLLFLYIFSILLITILVIDWEHMIIPDQTVFLLIILGLFYLIFSNNESLFIHIFSGFAVSLFLLLLHFLTLGRGMGLGDVKLAIFGGFFFGFPGTLVWIFTSFILGGIIGVILLIFGKAKLGRPIPFGPFLIFSFFISLFWGEKLTEIFLPGLF